MLLRELCENLSIFNSLVWWDFVEEVRAYIDGPDATDPYRINTINDFISDNYGEWEVLPKFYVINDGESIINRNVVKATIDAQIGAYKPYWERLLQTQLAEFDPLYNVDAHEITTTEYGEHETTSYLGSRTRTDTLGATEQTAVYGEQSTTEGQREDSSTEGQQTITQKETTMDNTASFKNKSQEEHDEIENGYTKGEQTNTTEEHTDVISTTPATNTSVDSAAEDGTVSGEHTDKVTVRRYGNIGVTMSTQLLRDFQRFAKESQLVQQIAETLARSLTFSIWY